MKQCLLSTVDNPFDPFYQFDEWYRYDCEKGYNCSGTMMRVAKVDDSMSMTEENAEIERAIDRIIEIDPLNLYKKVVVELDDPTDEDFEEV